MVGVKFFEESDHAEAPANLALLDDGIKQRRLKIVRDFGGK